VQRVVFVTQLIDPEHPVLGFVVPQIRKLAERIDHLTVIANEVRTEPSSLPVELVSLGKERGRGRIRRGCGSCTRPIHRVSASPNGSPTR